MFRQIWLIMGDNQGLTVLLVAVAVDAVVSHNGSYWSRLNLPHNHIPYFLFGNTEIQQKCDKDKNCPFKVSPTILPSIVM